MTPTTPKPTNVTGTTRANLTPEGAVIADALHDALRIVDAAGLPDDLRAAAFAVAADAVVPRRTAEHAV